MRRLLLIGLSAFIFSCSNNSGPGPGRPPALAGACPLSPAAVNYSVQSSVSRNAEGFTEGFIFENGNLLESTGAYGGPSVIDEINPATGAVQVLRGTPAGDFGEGLAFYQNQYYQLTYTSGVVFVYDAAWNLLQTRPSPLSQGWGLTVDGSQFIASDGSDRLYFVSPDFSRISRSVTVQDGSGKTYGSLNQLQLVGSIVYANQFLTDNILAVDAGSGCVEGILNMSPLYGYFTAAEMSAIRADPNNVLNGIALDPNDGSLYVTGKNWPKIFKIIVRGR